MSDNARRFRAVQKAMLKFFPANVTPRLAQHLRTLSAMVTGLVASHSTHLPKIAQTAPDHTKPESRVKRFYRFLNSDGTTIERYYLPWARELAASLSDNRTLVVIFDGSTVGRGCATLMACLVYRRRALPLIWKVKQGTKGSFLVQDQLDLLADVKAIVPEGRPVVFLGDGEFDSLDLLKAIEAAGWHYVCRTARSKRASDGFSECAIGELSPVFGASFVSIPEARFTAAAYGPLHVIAWHEARHRSPVFLVTNLELAEEAMYWYRRRFRIETLFSDQKSRGFNVQRSHISDPVRLERLLIALALAYRWMIYLGEEALSQGYNKVFHRSDRVDLSLFQLGLRLLEYLLNKGKPIPVAFTLSPPSQTVR